MKQLHDMVFSPSFDARRWRRVRQAGLPNSPDWCCAWRAQKNTVP
jgi:hypothetical protein